jgi:hypothetical protein
MVLEPQSQSNPRQTCGPHLFSRVGEKADGVFTFGIAVEQRHVANAVRASPQRDVATRPPLLIDPSRAKLMTDALS